MPKNSRIKGLLLFLLGFMALLSSLSKPRIEALHGTDILGLIGCGFCFGVGFAGLLGGSGFGRNRRHRSPADWTPSRHLPDLRLYDL